MLKGLEDDNSDTATHHVQVCHFLLFVKLLFTICGHALDLLHIIHNTCFFIKKQDIKEGIKFRSIKVCWNFFRIALSSQFVLNHKIKVTRKISTNKVVFLIEHNVWMIILHNYFSFQRQCLEILDKLNILWISWDDSLST